MLRAVAARQLAPIDAISELRLCVEAETQAKQTSAAIEAVTIVLTGSGVREGPELGREDARPRIYEDAGADGAPFGRREDGRSPD